MSKDQRLKQSKIVQVKKKNLNNIRLFMISIIPLGILCIIIATALIIGTIWLYILRTFTKVNYRIYMISAEI